jgi:hypothetical protein
MGTVQVESRMRRQSPEKVVKAYYDAMEAGELSAVKALMTKESYLMTLESFGLALAFHDPAFKTLLRHSEKNLDALQEVEKAISADLKVRHGVKKIVTGKIISNGAGRVTVHFEENGRSKKLYLSEKGGRWLLDYKAGRRTR